MFQFWLNLKFDYSKFFTYSFGQIQISGKFEFLSNVKLVN